MKREIRWTIQHALLESIEAAQILAGHYQGIP